MIHLILQPQDTSHPFLKHPMSALGETIQNRQRKTKQRSRKTSRSSVYLATYKMTFKLMEN